MREELFCQKWLRELIWLIISRGGGGAPDVLFFSVFAHCWRSDEILQCHPAESNSICNTFLKNKHS